MLNTINELQTKINSISNTIDSNSVSENNNNQNSVNTSSNSNLNKEDIDKIAKELFENGSEKIRELFYTECEEYEVSRPLTEKTINGITYQKRNVLYSDVEKEYAKIFTGEALNKVLSKRFIEIDGYLYVSYGGATGWSISNIKLSKISEGNNEIKYNVKYNDVDIADNVSEEHSCTMTIKLVNGDYRISSTDYEDI